MRHLVFVVALATTALLARAASAWDGDVYWYDPAQGAPPPQGQQYAVMPGAGGILATGGALDHNVTCADCHVKGKNPTGLVDTQFLFDGQPSTGKYVPGRTYTVTAKLVGEHLGLSGCGQYVTGNVNNFAAAFEDDGGNRAGTLASDGNTSSANCAQRLPSSVTGTTLVYGDCHAILSHTSNAMANATQWTFSWTAPASGTGTVTLWYGMVDGDCMMDSLNDDVKVGNLKLNESTASNAPPFDANRALAMAGLLPAVGIVAAARKRRR